MRSLKKFAKEGTFSSVFVLFFLAIFLLAPVSIQAEELAKDQIFRFGMQAADINSLDPAFGTSDSEDNVNAWIYNGLTMAPIGTVNFDKLEGDLAEKWEVSKDGKTWTFYLRKGVYWHDGNELFAEGQAPELSAEDVKYTFDRLRDPDVGSAFGADYKSIEAINVIDKYTVAFKLKDGNPFFPIVQTLNFRGARILCKKAGEKFGKKGSMGTNYPIGTGPFEVVKYIPKEKVILKANEDYFRGAPTIKTVEYNFMPDVSSMTMALLGGRLDAVYGIRDPSWIESLTKRNPKIVVDTIPIGSGGALHFNMTVKPLDNIKVRKALSLALNHQIFKDRFGDIMLDMPSPVPPAYLGSLPMEDIPPEILYPYYETDLNRAEELLKEAGYADGFKIHVFTTPMKQYQTVFLIAQDAWKKIGVNLDIELVDHSTYHAYIRKNRNDVVSYFGDRAPVADSYLTQWYHSDSIVGRNTAITNFSHYGEVDANGDGLVDSIDWLIEEARKEINQERQKKLYAMAQLQLLRDIPAYPIGELQKVLVRQPWVDLGVKFTGTMPYVYPLEKARILKH